jgi:hypothetical protein
MDEHEIDAVAWLREQLTAGGQSVAHLGRLARRDGLEQSSLLLAALAMGLIVRRDGAKPAVWSLPEVKS